MPTICLWRCLDRASNSGFAGTADRVDTSSISAPVPKGPAPRPSYLDPRKRYGASIKGDTVGPTLFPRCHQLGHQARTVCNLASEAGKRGENSQAPIIRNPTGSTSPNPVSLNPATPAFPNPSILLADLRRDPATGQKGDREWLPLTQSLQTGWSTPPPTTSSQRPTQGPHQKKKTTARSFRIGNHGLPNNHHESFPPNLTPPNMAPEPLHKDIGSATLTAVTAIWHCNCEGLGQEQKTQLQELLLEYRDSFATSAEETGSTHLAQATPGIQFHAQANFVCSV
ncbi:UNVERIFIED_CONTAM: hypothetical protein FKN15_025739 [Acipenser sinensis]